MPACNFFSRVSQNKTRNRWALVYRSVPSSLLSVRSIFIWLLTATCLTPGVATSAQITFIEAYTGTISLTGGDGLQSNNINSIVDLGATSYRLESIPASAASFAASSSGNNVNSKLYYRSGGVDYVITGQVSRQDKSGSTPISFYFYDPVAIKGYLLVRRGYESSYAPNANVPTSTDFTPSPLDTAATEEPAIWTKGGAHATEGALPCPL